MGVTISGMTGRGSIRHNNRVFSAENIDQSRTAQNITFCREDLKSVYHDLFDAPLADYNAKKTKTRDKIPDYYEHIRTGKQEKLFHEVVFQLGDKDSCGCGSADGERAAVALKEFAESFQARNPHLRVFNSTLHMDEATPHLHIDFVPVATEQKRGLSTRVSMKQALKQQGFVSKGKQSTEWQAWMQREKQVLADLAKTHDLEIDDLGGGRKHMDLPEYRAAAQRLEAVKEQVASAERSVAVMESRQKKLQQDIAKADRKKDALEQRVKVLEAIEIRQSEIDGIQPKRTITGAVNGVTVEQIEQLKKAAKRGLRIEYLNADLKTQVDKLTAENKRVWEKVPSLEEKKEQWNDRNELKRLRKENEELRGDLQGIDKILEKINATLSGIEGHLPEMLLPLLDGIRQMVQNHTHRQERSHQDHPDRDMDLSR